MYHDLQPKPLFVPFQKPTATIFPTLREQYMARAVKSALVAFLIAVVLVSYTTNRYEEKLREAKAAALTCQASTSQAPNTAPRQE